jgi:sugar lactone lactonase YvrE
MLASLALTAAPDPLAARPDTAVVRAAPGATRSDTPASRAAGAPSDTGPIRPDSAAVRTDTLAMRADTPAAVPDSLPLRLEVQSIVAQASTSPGEVVRPSGVACDAFGRIYVTDAALHRLQRYDGRGTWLGQAGTLGSSDGQMRRPGGVAILGTLSVAVLDQENRRVLSYDLFGRLQGTLIDLNDLELVDQLGRVDAIDLAADRGGAVYVVDAERDRVLVFDFSGRYVRTVGGFGARLGSFRGLGGVAVTPHGELVVAERINARVQRLDSGGHVIVTWPLPVGPSRGALPVAVDDTGRVAVADEASGRLWVFAGTGRLLATLSGLGAPRALAFARDRSLLVAESKAGRVRRFRLVPQAEAPAAREN